MDEALLISLRYEASAACPRPMADCDTTGLAPWSVHCAIQKIAEKWTTPLQNWALTISQLHVYFQGRLQLSLNV